MYGHVLQRLREHLNVPGSSSVDKEPLTRELRRLLSRLNETSGGFSKIVRSKRQLLSHSWRSITLINTQLIHQFAFRHADAVNLVLLRAGITLFT